MGHDQHDIPGGEIGNEAAASNGVNSQAHMQALLRNLAHHEQNTNNGTLTSDPNNSTQPADLAVEEPMYVNAKQYNRILKRRDARARWEQTVRNVRKEKVRHDMTFYLYFLPFLGLHSRI